MAGGGGVKWLFARGALRVESFRTLAGVGLGFFRGLARA